VNREHNPNLLCGKAVQFYDRSEGLVADLKIAKTTLGEEALQLAEEGCLSASVGFGAGRDDCDFDRRTMTRRIKRAYLDHIALVQSPAYIGAEVLSVREAPPLAAPSTRVATPNLDAAIRDDMLRWADERLNRQ
jgi:phage head maturation protease